LGRSGSKEQISNSFSDSLGKINNSFSDWREVLLEDVDNSEPFKEAVEIFSNLLAQTFVEDIEACSDDTGFPYYLTFSSSSPSNFPMRRAKSAKASTQSFNTYLSYYNNH
jgi:hypothetical protein